jgi:uncharacterized membrane protein YsdA (DUF1294 family)
MIASLLLVAFTASLSAAYLAGASSGVVPLFYLAVSLATFAVYAFDKRAACNGRWRTPERTLHLLSVAGGWPGAMLAQKLLHHKTRKQPFQYLFAATVIVNCAALICLWYGTSLRESILSGRL